MEIKTLEDKVAAYVKIRDHKKAMEAEYKKGVERLNLAMVTLEADLLKELQEQGVESARSKAGTVYLRKDASASVANRDAFMEYLNKTGEWEALDVRANKTIVREILGRGETIPGVNYSEVITIGVRRS